MNDLPVVVPQPELEKRVLDFWREEKILDKLNATRHDGKPFVFYDGPPFTTGLPHVGHILQMAVKDAVLRYKTMQGYAVPRKIGWDTHGLPVEYELEKELGISGKRQIEEYGIEKFVNDARNIVLRYTKEWTSTMERMGRWMDLSDPYATMNNDYIESVWWAFSELYKKGLIYQDYRVSPYCPRCGTVLANFEVNQGYRDNVPDVSVYVALELLDGPFAGASIIFWTTTPWTIPAVTGMSVQPSAHYIMFQSGGKKYIMAAERVPDVFAHYDVIQELSGEELLNAHYRPLYKLTDDANAHRIVAGAHVTTDDGTGIASIAPAYGEVDSEVGRHESLPFVQTIDRDGTVKQNLGLPGEGQFVKKIDSIMVADLTEKEALVKTETIHHTYPFCWRCDTPLLYYPTTSWFVQVTAVKDQLIAENKKIKWLPEHLRDGRFGRWLEGARDWAISRERYWGAPLPVWECQQCHTRKVVGSRAELSELGTFDLQDLHRPYIDAVRFTCHECQGEMKRVPFVFDCWFESGSMPYAQHHYPFNKDAHFNPHEQVGYPADFIAEALDQTRGWFYSLHVLGVALFGSRAYNSVVVSGLLLAGDGKKLSKRLRNYTEPEVLFEEQGVDALRLFLFTATGIGEDYRFSDTAVNDVRRRWITPLLNVVQYYQLNLVEQDSTLEPQPEHQLLDDWMKARVFQTQELVFQAMDGDSRHSPYDIVRACRTFGDLIEDLSTWYVRLSRGRHDRSFTLTLQSVLQAIAELYAPFLPFLMEHIYQIIKSPDDLLSIHLHLSHLRTEWENPSVLTEMDTVRNLVSLGREARKQLGIPLKQPLGLLEMRANVSSSAQSLIAQELQIEEVVQVQTINDSLVKSGNGDMEIGFDTTITPELKKKAVANNLRRLIQDLRKQASLQPHDEAEVIITGVDDQVQSYVSEQLTNTRLVVISQGQPTGNAEYQDDSITATVTLFTHVST